ncbi:acyltransferase family protein [Bacteroides caccae]|jgi:nodulation acetyltransferase protein|uniref:Acyltransferase family protein n=3 Tax=Bacteroides caccae TaxID=47678 RepID=A0A9P4DZT0_9BACE|nr:acyltransferase family protein [Bacteroides caccae]KAA2316633.1 acyltransferase family protein [Bacteroides caccae]KAA2323587.1 acyltransferase family protein [Bacteroides caccae]KAA2333338.1 acyltransferase family protein [Bacteroides caccae]KAA2334533.1 acyltransferase family protein [Bacteroides caccae]KAA2335116.1 acyltransferase family protein [Bacteroides caccae]
MMNHRLHYIDNLKGVLILLVVLGHCIQCTDLDFDHNAVFRYIYSFHMPLFMCVSGFVSYKPDIKWQTVQKRFRQLIIPFLAWAAVSCCVHLDPTLFLAKVVHPDSGLWFLWALFFIVLLMWLCNWVVACLKVKIEYVVCIFSLLMMGIMVALKFKLFGFQFIAWYFPFYAIGFFGRKYQNLWEKQGRIGSLWLSILFLFMAYWWMRKDPPLFMTQNSHVIYNYAYKFVVAILAIVAFIPLFKSYLNRTMLIITKMGG